MKQKLPKPASQQGVVLLESLIAILIFSFGVLGIVGLQASMVKSTSDAKFRSEAAYIVQQRIGQMWSDPDNLADYVEEDTDISALLPGGTRTVEIDASGQYVVTVTWQQPGEPVHNYTTIASIVGG